MKDFPIVAATGQLGSGFQPQSLEKAAQLGARMIGSDAGGTDPGPNNLATGAPYFGDAAVKSDLSCMLQIGRKHKIPVIIGTAGTSGSDEALAAVVDIVRQIARENRLGFKLATIRSELSRDTVVQHLRQGRTRPLPPAVEMTEEMIGECLHIVGLMGIEPYQDALKTGADVIIAGRSSDTSIFAALPIMEGYPPGPVWHMAKILECGAAAVTHRTAPDSMMGIVREDSFDVFPLRHDYRCTPQSVASHTLYENADPFNLVEPSGTLITRDAQYEAISDRAVRVTGSRYVPSNVYTIKIEGVRAAGYSTIVMGGIRDPYILQDLDTWLTQLNDTIKTRITRIFGERDYEIVTRIYGKNGVMGQLEPKTSITSHEIFILWDILSPSQELSQSIAKSVAHLASHNPIPKWHGLISGVAFPFSPAEIDRGPIFEFGINHVLVPETPTSLFRIAYEEI